MKLFKILTVSAIYLLSMSVMSTTVKQSKNSEVYAGRHDKKPTATKYNLSGLPVGRKWLTSREWKGRHIKDNDVVTRSRFKAWKQIHIEQFVKFFGAEIQKEVNENFPDLCASVIVAQAIIESNFGLSRLAVEGNALFGHKFRGQTKRYIVAADDSPTDKFSVYPSQWFSIRAHSHLMNNKYKRRISGAYNRDSWLIALCGATTAKQARKVRKSTGRSVYATSCLTAPCYSQKLKRVIKAYNLTRFDKK